MDAAGIVESNFFTFCYKIGKKITQHVFFVLSILRTKNARKNVQILKPPMKQASWILPFLRINKKVCFKEELAVLRSDSMKRNYGGLIFNTIWNHSSKSNFLWRRYTFWGFFWSCPTDKKCKCSNLKTANEAGKLNITTFTHQ